MTRVVATTRARTAGRVGVPWVSDGWEPYAEVIEQTYRDPMPSGIRDWGILRRTVGTGLTQAIKRREGRRLIRVDVQATIGPMVEQPYPVHVERLNGVLRDRVACLTRKTHAFAKHPETWDAVFTLALFEQNWLRPHAALRVPLETSGDGRRYRRQTPAMAAGLTDHVWTFQQFLTRPAYQQ